MQPVLPVDRTEIAKFIIKFLKSRKLLEHEENVVYCDKAFIIASVLRFCHNEKIKGKINEKHITAYFKALYEFEQGNIELLWHEGIVKAKKLVGEKPA